MEAPNVLEEEVGLGILLATLAIALVITVVGITVPIIEAQERGESADSSMVQNQLEQAVLLRRYNKLERQLGAQKLDIQELQRRVHDIEMELRASGGGP